jgi:hypothetical protein
LGIFPLERGFLLIESHQHLVDDDECYDIPQDYYEPGGVFFIFHIEPPASLLYFLQLLKEV